MTYERRSKGLQIGRRDIPVVSDANTRPSDNAMHEAGHYVVAVFYEIPVYGISIVQEGESLGRNKVHLVPPERLPKALHSSIGAKRYRFAIAGALAQVRGTRRDWRRWPSVSDEALAMQGLSMQGCHDAPAQALAMVLHAQAVRGLFQRTRVWPAVLTIAAALDVEREMDQVRLSDFDCGLPTYRTVPHDEVLELETRRRKAPNKKASRKNASAPPQRSSRSREPSKR